MMCLGLRRWIRKRRCVRLAFLLGWVYKERLVVVVVVVAVAVVVGVVLVALVLAFAQLLLPSRLWS